MKKDTIDLRSDTFTTPDDSMRSAMAQAKVGDDVFQEDPTVNLLQETIADYFGKESALFVPSGTMSNQLGIRVHVNDGDEVICENEAHIFYYETAAPSLISRVQLRPLLSETGEIELSDIHHAQRGPEYYYPETKLLCLESTHNRHGGFPLSTQYMSAIGEWKKNTNIATHLDGARIWNSIAELNVDPKDYVANFDTISVCFSKGLGAPVGSALVGSKLQIQKALKWRKILGGGMRQAGIIAAGALYAFENNLPNLKVDHDNLKVFAQHLAQSPHINFDINSVRTNIMKFNTPNIKASSLVEACKSQGLLFMATGDHSYRIVTHLQITPEMLEQAAEIITNQVRDLSSNLSEAQQ